MSDVHSELLDPEIHNCKGFSTADLNTLPVKNGLGVMQWVPTNSLTGVPGPPGPSIAQIQVANSLNPIELNLYDSSDFSQVICNKNNLSPQDGSNLYVYDDKVITNEDPPFIMRAKDNNGSWSFASGTLGTWLSNVASSTTVVDGGVVSTNNLDNTKVDISAIKILFSIDFNAPTENRYHFKEFPAQIGVSCLNIATADYTLFSYDLDGNLIKQNTPLTSTQRRELCRIGFAYHPTPGPSATILKSGSLSQNNYSVGITQADIFSAFGSQNAKGNVYSPNGANLKLDKSSGETLSLGINWVNDKKNPNYKTDIAITSASFDRAYRDSASTWSMLREQTNIDPNNYNDLLTNTLVSVTAGYFTIQYIFWNTIVETTSVIYGQQEYVDFNTALSNIDKPFEVPEQYSQIQSTYRAALVIKQGTTDLQTAVANGTARFVPINPRYGSSGSASNVIATLQSAYDASVDGKITIAAKGPLGLQADSISLTTLFSIKDQTATNVFSVERDGNISGKNATNVQQGLMSSTDKTKLDRVLLGWAQYSNSAVFASASPTAVAVSMNNDQNSFFNGLFDKPSATEIRALFAGFVRISFAGYATATSANDSGTLQIFKNGVLVPISSISQTSSGGLRLINFSKELLINCAANDVFSLNFLSPSSSSITFSADSLTLIVQAVIS